MSLIPWRNKQEGQSLSRPETNISRFRSEMDRLFDRFFQTPWDFDLPELFGRQDAWGPRIDLAESDKEVTVRVELPGVDPEDVDINVSGNVLTLHGEKKQEHEEKKQDYHYMERRYGSFHRSVQLPNSVDADKVDATYKKGILTVTLAKRPEALPRKIKVKQV